MMNEIVPKQPKHSFTIDNARLNVYHANRGEGLPAHIHTYSHLTFCCNGSCIVRKSGKEVILTKDDTPVNLLGGEWHEIEALEDETVIVNVFSENFS